MGIRFRLILLLAAAMCTTFRIAAQTDPLLSQHYAVPTLYNPAAAGSTDWLRIRGGARLQWVGVDNAPRSFVATADMPLRLFGRHFGVGAVMTQESLGLFHNLSLGLQAGYRFKRLGGSWSVALQVGFYDQSFKGSEIYIPEDDNFHQGNDEGLPTTDLHGTAIDLGAGIQYSHKYFTVGLGCTHLTSPTVTYSGDTGGRTVSRDAATGEEQIFEFKARRSLYFTAEGNIPVRNTLFEILPSVIVASDFNATTAVVTARTRWRKLLSFGLGYRCRDALTATVAVELRNFFAGYSYDYSTSAIAKASSGSHELFVGYRLHIDTGDKNKNKHKSIRIM